MKDKYMRVKLENGKCYFYQTEYDTSIFMCLVNTELKSSNTFFNAFIFVQQSENENLDGWNGPHQLAMNNDQANNMSSLDASFDWLVSNSFAEGTPKQQLIQACFDAIY
jgi:hypothetical protein